MTATIERPPAIRDADWQRLTWHKRAQLVLELGKRATILHAQVDQLLAERADLEAAIEAIRADIEATIDLRGRPSVVRIIWAHDYQWSAEELRRAHANHSRGLRDEWTVTGHRIWDKQRHKKRREEAGQTCPDCGGKMTRRSARCRACYVRSRGVAA